MGSLNNTNSGDAANSSCIQQVIDVLKGTVGAGNVPISLTAINDSANFALDVKNLDPTNERTFRAQNSSGQSVLQCDITGPQADPTGSGLAPIVNTNATQTLSNKTLTAPVITSPAGGVFGAWSTFTPSIAQGVGLTFTNTHAEYVAFGKTIHARGRFVFTSTGTAANSIDVTLVGAMNGKNSNALPEVIGSAYISQGSTQLNCVAHLVGTATVRFSAGAPINYVGVSPSFALAVNDILSFQLTYEGA